MHNIEDHSSRCCQHRKRSRRQLAIVLYDITGRQLETNTKPQRELYSAKRRVLKTGNARRPEEWRLPKAPAPSRPDFSRALSRHRLKKPKWSLPSFTESNKDDFPKRISTNLRYSSKCDRCIDLTHLEIEETSHNARTSSVDSVETIGSLRSVNDKYGKTEHFQPMKFDKIDEKSGFFLNRWKQRKNEKLVPSKKQVDIALEIWGKSGTMFVKKQMKRNTQIVFTKKKSLKRKLHTKISVNILVNSECSMPDSEPLQELADQYSISSVLQQSDLVPESDTLTPIESCQKPLSEDTQNVTEDQSPALPKERKGRHSKKALTKEKVKKRRRTKPIQVEQQEEEEMVEEEEEEFEDTSSLATEQSMDILRKYCIIKPSRLTFYERIFQQSICREQEKYERFAEGTCEEAALTSDCLKKDMKEQHASSDIKGTRSDPRNPYKGRRKNNVKTRGNMKGVGEHVIDNDSLCRDGGGGGGDDVTGGDGIVDKEEDENDNENVNDDDDDDDDENVNDDDDDGVDMEDEDESIDTDDGENNDDDRDDDDDDNTDDDDDDDDDVGDDDDDDNDNNDTDDDEANDDEEEENDDEDVSDDDDDDDGVNNDDDDDDDSTEEKEGKEKREGANERNENGDHVESEAGVDNVAARSMCGDKEGDDGGERETEEHEEQEEEEEEEDRSNGKEKKDKEREENIARRVCKMFAMKNNNRGTSGQNIVTFSEGQTDICDDSTTTPVKSNQQLLLLLYYTRLREHSDMGISIPEQYLKKLMSTIDILKQSKDKLINKMEKLQGQRLKEILRKSEETYSEFSRTGSTGESASHKTWEMGIRNFRRYTSSSAYWNPHRQCLTAELY